MAQLTDVGQGQQQWTLFVGPSIMLLLSLVFALLGIKTWGFRRRLTFDHGRSSTTARGAQQQQQPQSAPRYAAYESQINGIETAVHGVFRQRNTEDIEYTRPAGAAANKFPAGSVPNLEVANLVRNDYKKKKSIPDLDAPVPHQQKPQASQSSANYDYYILPPTRQPPPPPIAAEEPPELPAAEAAGAAAGAVAAAEASPSKQLDFPNFDHFAEKYALISAKLVSGDGKESQLRMKQIGDYIKYEQVDDVPEILTPDDDQVGAPISVAAQVHQAPSLAVEPKHESELTTEMEPVPAPRATIKPDSRSLNPIVKIVDHTPESTDLRHPKVEHSLLADLELPQHLEDAEFERIRSSYEMNEADILDMQAEQLPSPTSPPGFGKTIDDDWENFENLECVTNPLQPLELPRQDQIEMINSVQQEESASLLEPPPYKQSLPASPPILPDYESLMQLEATRANRKLPNYSDVVSERKETKTRYVSNIEDLFEELQSDDDVSSPSSLKVVRDFDALCEELNIAAPSPVPARRPPQPAPRTLRPTTLGVRADLPPLLRCHEPEESASTSSSEQDAADIAAPSKRINKSALKVRFDVENLQYYQAPELSSSSDSDIRGELDEPQLPSIHKNLGDDTPSPLFDQDIPRLFGTQVSLEDSDDEHMGRILRQHRTLTQTLSSIKNRESDV